MVRNDRLVLLLGALLAGAAPLAAQDEVTPANRACQSCHGASADTIQFACGTQVPLLVDNVALLESAHGRLDCVACHVGLDVLEHTALDRPTRAEYRTLQARQCAGCHSAAAPAIAGHRPPPILRTLHPSTVAGAPLCSDCHPAHGMRRGGPGRHATARACARCHEAVYAAYAGSVHGTGVLAPVRSDSPTCVDCHRGHVADGNLVAAQNRDRGQPCMGCHGDADLMRRYGISTKVVSTYLNDFHGTSVRFYDAEQARDPMPTLVCADCHGVHDVVRVTAGSPVLMKEHLLQVCRRCHPDATENFPDAWLSHYEPSPTRAPLVFAVKLAYWIFIPFVIIGLGLQIFAHVVLFPRRKRRQRRQAADSEQGDGGDATPAPGDEHGTVVRFGRRHRIEHLLVIVTFVLLLLTGLPQKFHDTGWAVWLTGMLGGIDLVRAIHRATGIAFAALCVLHLTVAAYGVISGRTGATIMPRVQDFRDAIANLKYYVGLADRQPVFDRYDYRQKFEYWGMVIGSAVMIGSGFVLYFPLLFAQFLPGQFIPAAKAAHTYEAMMALLTIVIWHMYGAHLNPDCFPLDRSIFTGRISLRRMRHEHALEYQRLRHRLQVEAAAPPAAAAAARPDPAAAGPAD